MLLVSAGLLVAALAPGEAPAVRIITFNIHHAEGDDAKVDLDRIARVVLGAKPDIVCLQEVDRNLPRTGNLDFPALLGEKLKMRAIFDANYRFDNGEYGNATFSNLEAVSWQNHKLPGPAGLEPRGCLEVKFKVGDATLSVLNTHLGLKREEREEQAAAILAFLPAGHAVLAGDLNETPTGKPVLQLLTRLSDTFNAVATAPAKTFSTTVLNRRIDYVLASPGIRVRESRILNDLEAATASDHLPYVTEIEIP